MFLRLFKQSILMEGLPFQYRFQTYPGQKVRFSWFAKTLLNALFDDDYFTFSSNSRVWLWKFIGLSLHWKRV